MQKEIKLQLAYLRKRKGITQQKLAEIVGTSYQNISNQVEAWPLAEQWRWLTTWLVWRRGAKTRPLEAFIQLLDVPDSAKQGYQ